jgi:probable rRNA maturation factor
LSSRHTLVNVFVANEQEISVDEVRLGALARHALNSEDVSEAAELSILLIGSDHIRRLNHRFAGDDYATDVLAFPMMEGDEHEALLGDVVICPPVASDNAAKLGHSLEAELDTLVVHGTLHLLGYDHHREDDKARMYQRQQEILHSFTSSDIT